MSRKNNDLEKRVGKIEEMVVKRNSTDVFENINFLIASMRRFDDILGNAQNQINYFRSELGLYNLFMEEEKLQEKFQEFRKRKIEESRPKPKEEIEKKLEEQKKKLEELNED